MTCCSACSMQLVEGARFCSNCGTSVQSAPVPRVAEPDGGLFDATCGVTSREEAEKLVWEALAPHLAEAQRISTVSLIQSAEWAAKLISRRPKGPLPKLSAHTPFFTIVYAIASAREQYEDVLLSELDDLSKTYSIEMTLLSRLPATVDSWKVVIDPDGVRLKPRLQLPTLFEVMSDQYYYSITWKFTASAVSTAKVPLVVALLRLGYEEVRYQFSGDMR